MKQVKKRKEIVLSEETLAVLEEKAKNQGRNLKNYMEFILNEVANNILEEPKALEIKKALILSRSQSEKGLIKSSKQVINAAKKRIDASSVDKTS
ncbi:hypothetical protein FPF71_01495 [Algibacter amylolyticus]|uniref:Uncharacterized protein n=1 Tax=Algibacter amylolyticus TaxID=1608400 RepID=A0A5M7BDI1_9FLAO|nr:hypothetical protein [Algibacter amylolyticus]KAA5827542.1 hypothetical protein F2B50_01495 [Algibacter amylolyticus]MBB5266748.1 hypothetical protein [Algibacter amylolyticus]TSJ81787.1 hypothetical protein FPF71_01495 [Algibacter amylolyticus]